MNIVKALALIAVSVSAMPVYADDLDVACGSYRRIMNETNQRCNGIKLQLDKNSCMKDSLMPAQNAYQTCVVSFNQAGAKKTMEKAAQAKKQKPIPDAAVGERSSGKTLGL